MTWILNNLGLIWSLTLDHVVQCVPPIIVGFLLALPVGWIAHRYTRVRGVVLSVVGVLYAIPSFGLFAVLSSLFGIPYLSPTNLVVALTIYAIALLTRSVADAFDSVDHSARQAATAIGYSRVRRFFAVELPLAGPVLLAGLRVATVSTVALATVGILIGVENLGYLFTNGSQRRIVAEVVAGVVVVGLMAWIFDLILVAIGRALMPWNRPVPRERRSRQEVSA